ncbi:thiamine biosynthesis protein ThiS [Saccharomonospora marina XMU15]|uniref:Thiamine biosynthesis protein ThiS n=1 Tax=Saccharomonospora marina XMU15 TaxID=882083 RepID=H5WZZ8_9PSEU|nr:sulfur carrier protein ThiS [Saccharomonospora marina]EHR52994.1 thiamine biosynthesis protein ThiS [Saccharomonospora marina XMU15]
MRVHVNGEEREFPEGSTVADLLTAIGTEKQGVAVALEGEVVRRHDWADVVVPNGAHLEILTAVQGG